MLIRDFDIWKKAVEARAMLDDQLRKENAQHLFVDIGLPSSDADATDISLRVHTREERDTSSLKLIDSFNDFPVVIRYIQEETDQK